jgi:hypothetical protein
MVANEDTIPALLPDGTAAPGAPTADVADAERAALDDAAAEAEAWSAVVARWDDEAAHRAYLARLGDLDGLAAAGRRYRGVLADRPGDPIALRFRDEVVKRATVQGLATLPRVAPAPAASGVVRRLILVACVLFGGIAAWAVVRLARLLLGGLP